MEYRKEFFTFANPAFPFSFLIGHGFSREETPFFHCHDVLELNYCPRGTGTYYIGNETYCIHPGDFFIINNSEYHYAANEGDLTLKVLFFNTEFIWQTSSSSLDQDYLKTFFEWKDHFKHHFTFENDMVEYIATMICEIEHEWNGREIGYQLIIKAILLKILGILYRNFEETEAYAVHTTAFQEKYNRILPAIDYIQQHFQEKLSLSVLAETVHMNKNYFSELFSNIMGVPVTQYIMDRRLSSACVMLRATRMSVTDIAAEAGFSDVSYFNRCFAEKMKTTPTDYRAGKNCVTIHQNNKDPNSDNQKNHQRESRHER